MSDVYVKKGRKYVPIGMTSGDRGYLPEGIYAVMRRPGVTMTVNLRGVSDIYGLYKVSDVPHVDLSMVAGLERHVDMLAKGLMELDGEPLSYADKARRLMALMVEISKEDKNMSHDD